MLNEINDSLDVDLEEQGEINKIKKSLHLKTDAYGDYLEWFAKFWKKNINPNISSLTNPKWVFLLLDRQFKIIAS